MKRKFWLLGLIAISALASAAGNDEILAAEGYIQPPSRIADAVLAPWHENISGGSLDPARERLLVTRSSGLAPLDWLGAPHVILGGLQIDTVAERARNLTTRGSAGYTIITLANNRRLDIQVPSGARVSGGSWSPDGKSIAFLAITDKDTTLCVADAQTGKVRKLTSDVRLTNVTSFDWLADSSAIVLPVKAGDKWNSSDALPMGPRVRISDDKPNSIRTYAGLLQTPEDIAYLKYLLTAQVGIVSVKDGKVRRVGEPRLLSGLDASPDGKAFLVSELEGEFTYLNPANSAANRQVLLDSNGKQVAEIERGGIRKVALKDDEKPMRRNNLAWHPFRSGLMYLRDQPLPEDSKEKAKKQLVLWHEPWGENDVEVLYERKDAFSLAGYGTDESTLFINVTSGKKTTTYAVKDGTETKVWETDSDTDFYERPGSLVYVNTPRKGRLVLMSPDNSVYLSGTRYFKAPLRDAPRPFIDRLPLDGSLKTTRIFESSAEVYEDADLLSADGSRLMITRQSASSVPQIVIKTGTQERQITDNRDYLPDITQARRERIKVKRADGFEFYVNIAIPAGGAKNPAFFWFYPTEYKDQKTYDESQRTYNKNRFPVVRSSSVDIFLRDGYAVVTPDCPITGEPSEANNTFVHQLIMNLSATIDALAERGWVDRTRLAIGGHSYGAFGTANALIHTPFFKAGIAGDGNYNRSLTPFGFQREPRQLWSAREVYTDVSALWNAEKLTGALLMYHGMEDQNMGTDPINSERMFAVLEALGKPSALYMYPFEDHGQIARETRLDMWARWIAWLDKWVKNADQSEPKEEEPKPREAEPVRG